MSKYFIGNFEVGDRIIASGNRLGRVSSVHKKIGITWENGHFGEYTPKQMQAWNYKKLSEEKEAIAPCQDLHNLTSAQELVQDSASLGCNSDLTLLEPQRLTNTAQASSNCDTQAYTTTETCEISQDLQNRDLDIICTPIESIYLQPPLPALHSPQKGNGLEVQTSVIASPPSSKPSENYSPNSQPLKTSQDSLPAPITQDNQQAHISEAWSEPLTSSGTMRNGLLSEAAILPAPTLESEYCWLRSPGALSSTGKGRPPGQTKQEAELKRLGLLNSCEVLNPAILCQWYEIPETWLDPLESRAATELLEECGRQQEIFSILESQRSPLTESSTSTPYVENQPPLTRANAKAGTYIIDNSESLGIIKQNLGFGFVVDWFSSEFTYNWERDDQVIAELAIASQSLIDRFFSQRETLKAIEDKSNIECTQQLQIGVRVCITKTRTQNLSQWVGKTATVTGINGETISVAAGDGREKKHLTLKKGWYEVIPENFLEETERSEEAVQKPKGRQCKGCLYKYIENKKLKNGSIVSYPRVIGHRQPDNPTHWRWGFNWEEKIDGEWKGRSIGSIPVGAIALIQSMQKEGVSLEEIIGFIRRAKSKKS
ncbi:hypothetical protein [Nostoc sp. UIC 10630]|uniref:hypothetical protein n=1 Tax=Nostoc sp. UIC 10630 TaxID=2100146 RepID=UPI001FB19F45|nr:hypothetical protein [Nostoc sp. UIC 10630]